MFAPPPLKIFLPPHGMFLIAALRWLQYINLYICKSLVRFAAMKGKQFKIIHRFC